jgi:hypothetical protein
MSEIILYNQQLESSAEAERATIAEILNELHDAALTFVDDSIEVDNPRLMAYLDGMSQFFATSKNNQQDTFRAVQEAFYFARAAGDLMIPKTSAEVKIGNYTSALAKRATDDYGIIEVMLEDVGKYLSDRPSIESLIDGAIDKLDPEGRCGFAAKIIATITFLQIEIGEQAKFSEIQSSLELFDSIIDDRLERLLR